MLKEVAEHHPVVLFTKENMDVDKHFSVVNIPTVRFIYGSSDQGITDNIQREWDPDRLVAVITAMGVLVGEAFSSIGINARRSVVHL